MLHQASSASTAEASTWCRLDNADNYYGCIQKANSGPGQLQPRGACILSINLPGACPKDGKTPQRPPSSQACILLSLNVQQSMSNTRNSDLKDDPKVFAPVQDSRCPTANGAAHIHWFKLGQFKLRKRQLVALALIPVVLLSEHPPPALAANTQMSTLSENTHRRAFQAYYALGSST